MFCSNTHLILFDADTKSSISRFLSYKEKNHNFFPYEKETDQIALILVELQITISSADYTKLH